MAYIEFDADELNTLIEIFKAHKTYTELDKLKNFRFSEDGYIVFEQNFMLTTTVKLSLATDAGGQSLLIEILSLAENYLGDKVLKKFIPVITEIIEQKTNKLLVKKSERQMTLDLSKILPYPILLKNCNISNQRLCLDVAIQKI